MHPLLDRNEAGEVVIRWPSFFKSLAISLVCVSGGMFLGQYFAGKEFRIAGYLSFAVVLAFTTLAWLYVKKRQAEGRSVRQFSLLAVFACVTAISMLLAIMAADRQHDLQKYAERQRIEQQLKALVGAGTVHVSGTTLVQVKRATFNDAELQAIIALGPRLEQVGAPLTMIDLTGTSITDQGAIDLSKISTLEYCYLSGTGVTDASLDAVGKLPNLKVLQAYSTGVTPEAVSTLRAARPKLDFEPRTLPHATKNAGSPSAKTPAATP
jgi:hypothetical protein